MTYLKNLKLSEVIESINEEKKEKDKFNFYLHVDTYRRLEKACTARGIAMSPVVDMVLTRLLDHWDEENTGKGTEEKEQ